MHSRQVIAAELIAADQEDYAFSFPFLDPAHLELTVFLANGDERFTVAGDAEGVEITGPVAGVYTFSIPTATAAPVLDTDTALVTRTTPWPTRAGKVQAETQHNSSLLMGGPGGNQLLFCLEEMADRLELSEESIDDHEDRIVVLEA